MLSSAQCWACTAGDGCVPGPWLQAQGTLQRLQDENRKFVQVLLAAWIWFIGLIGETKVRYGTMLVGIGFMGAILCQYACEPAKPCVEAHPLRPFYVVTCLSGT